MGPVGSVNVILLKTSVKYQKNAYPSWGLRIDSWSTGCYWLRIRPDWVTLWIVRSLAHLIVYCPRQLCCWSSAECSSARFDQKGLLITVTTNYFWFVKGRNFIKNIIHQCHVCRGHEGKPYNAPPPPPLPAFRVVEAPPFFFKGVDFAGPPYVKSDDGMKKVWICLCTCCVVKAVHLDLVPDQSTPAFIWSFKLFVSRRGF